jgi:drug/metabolite transporter (DMT)-like permease
MLKMLKDIPAMPAHIPFLLFAALLAISTSPILARFVPDVPAVGISFWRMAIGALLITLLCLFKPPKKMTPKNRNLNILAGFFLGIHFALFFGAIKLTSIANATFLGTLAPLFTLIIEKVFLKRAHSKGVLFGLALALSGGGVIIAGDFDFSSEKTIGNLLALICSLFIGGVLMISEKVRKEVETLAYLRTLFFSASLTLALLAILKHDPLLGYSSSDYGVLLALGIVPTLLGHGSLYYVVKTVSPTIDASVPLGEPVLASIIAWFLFQEPVGPMTMLGGGMTLFGLFVLIVKK